MAAADGKPGELQNVKKLTTVDFFSLLEYRRQQAKRSKAKK